MKIRPVGAELFHTDGRTYMTRQITFFFFFAEVLKFLSTEGTISFQTNPSVTSYSNYV